MTNKSENPFIEDPQHYGQMTVGQLVELVESDKSEFPLGLGTSIRIGDVEGNNGVVGEMTVVAHRSGDVVLAVDPHSGDEYYDAEG